MKPAVSVATCKQGEREKMSARRREEGEDGSSEEESDEDEPLTQVNSSSSSSSSPRINPEHPIIVQNLPEPVDDFLRNSLRRLGLSRTLSSFEAEWYGSVRVRPFHPDALSHSRSLQEELGRFRGAAEQLRTEALEAARSLAEVRRERDLHRLLQRRVSEQKAGLLGDRRRLQEHLEEAEEALRRLEEKHRAALRTRTLISLQTGRQRAQNLPEAEAEAEAELSQRRPRTQEAAAAAPCRLQRPLEAPEKTSFQLCCSIRAHRQPISGLALHPDGPLLASASDDRSWRLWRPPRGGEKAGQLLLTAEGHSDWLSGCSFHPDGSTLATTSGDATVRLWDVSGGRCVATLTGHSQPTWGSSFRPAGGAILASCSADGTARLWDVASRRCVLALRRHAASVNAVAFSPSSELLLTCSADRTLIMWDARRGVAAAVLRCHRHACAHAAFGPTPHAVASCDRRGVVHLWDTRWPATPTAAADLGPLGANQVSFHPSGRLLAVATGDGSVRLLEAELGSVSRLEGPGGGGGVQSVTFDAEGRALMSAGSDGLIDVWF